MVSASKVRTQPFSKIQRLTLGSQRADVAKMRRSSVKLAGLTPEGNLPLSTAFCLPPGMGKPGDESPGIRWSAGPAGTKSYVIISTDPDVVQNLSLMNKPGVTIPADAPRMDIYHWVLIDIPAIQHHIPPGGDGAHFVPGGRAASA